jgi:hypothetical protein
MDEAKRGLKIGILEDNMDRTVAMRAALADKLYTYEPHFLPTAPQMLSWLEEHADEAIAICLDHDLELPPDTVDRTDPGTGRDVANAMAAREPVCPVVIHTTNIPAGDGMEVVLRETGWRTYRVTPFDDLRWIREAWLPLLREAIFDTATEPHQPDHQLSATE